MYILISPSGNPTDRYQPPPRPVHLILALPTPFKLFRETNFSQGIDVFPSRILEDYVESYFVCVFLKAGLK